MSPANNVTRCGNIQFKWGERTYVMGIVNASPDSFSGDGNTDIEAAVTQGCRFVEEGADILDVGGNPPGPGLPRFQWKKNPAGGTGNRKAGGQDKSTNKHRHDQV